MLFGESHLMFSFRHSIWSTSYHVELKSLHLANTAPHFIAVASFVVTSLVVTSLVVTSLVVTSLVVCHLVPLL